MNAREQGIFHKFDVRRTDGRDAPGEKHHGADYFVLDLSDDPFAAPAAAAYAQACAAEYPLLARDLNARIAAHINAQSETVLVPETTLPGGLVVPAFRVGKFLASRSPSGLPQSTSTGVPWVEIDHDDTLAACAEAGLKPITESQILAIAFNASQHPANWSGCAVGEGVLHRGLHKGTVDRAQPGTYISPDPEEVREFVLSNGETIFDVAGNVYCRVFDDIQGDERGLTTIIKADSPSLSTPPFPSMEKGMGWFPDGERDWSGLALVRGGCWYSGRNAGAFGRGYDWPSGAYVNVGFRCTYPGL